MRADSGDDPSGSRRRTPLETAKGNAPRQLHRQDLPPREGRSADRGGGRGGGRREGEERLRLHRGTPPHPRPPCRPADPPAAQWGKKGDGGSIKSVFPRHIRGWPNCVFKIRIKERDVNICRRMFVGESSNGNLFVNLKLINSFINGDLSMVGKKHSLE